MARVPLRVSEREGQEITDLRQRLQRVEGQVHGIQRMLATGRSYVDILTQVEAARSALQGIAVILLRSHLHRCARRAPKAGGSGALGRCVNEILTAMSRVQRKGRL